MVESTQKKTVKATQKLRVPVPTSNKTQVKKKSVSPKGKSVPSPKGKSIKVNASSQEEKKSKHQYLILCRHCERYDDNQVTDAEREVRGPQDHELDTPLSFRGFE